MLIGPGLLEGPMAAGDPLGGFLFGIGDVNWNGNGSDTTPVTGTQSGDLLVLMTTQATVTGYSSIAGGFPNIVSHSRTATATSSDDVPESNSGAISQIFTFRDNSEAEYSGFAGATGNGTDTTMKTAANTDLTGQDYAVLLFGCTKSVDTASSVDPNGVFTESGQRLTSFNIYILGYEIQVSPASHSSQAINYAVTKNGTWRGNTTRVKVDIPP